MHPDCVFRWDDEPAMLAAGVELSGAGELAALMRGAQ